VTWLVPEQGIKARSGHGCPSLNEVGQSDAADLSEVLPRRGKTSVPARESAKSACLPVGRDPFPRKHALSEKISRGISDTMVICSIMCYILIRSKLFRN